MRRALALAALASGALMTGCFIEDNGPRQCDTSAAAGLNVAVRRADTGALLCDAVVDARSGSYLERLMALGPASDCRYAGAWERSGEYTVAIARDGFRSKVVSAVQVGRGECHVTGAVLDVELVPEPSSWAACAQNSDCTLAAASCCGVCGQPGVDDVDAVNKARLEEHKQQVCPSPVVCSACPTQNNPSLIATCAAEACQALDIRHEAASACASDGDCRLRVAGCCECGASTAPYELIAVNRAKEALYTSLVCDPSQACDECLPNYPVDVEAYCSAEGHCAVRAATAQACGLPFDPGPCDAAFPVFAFVDGACVERIYGGCGGNANRFATLEECMKTCEGRPDPEGCPAGRVSQSICLECGPAGGCGREAVVCAKACQQTSDCEAPLAQCMSGVCQAGGCI